MSVNTGTIVQDGNVLLLTDNGMKFNDATGTAMFVGAGDPNGVAAYSAPSGSIYLDKTNSRFWVCRGTTTWVNPGFTTFATAAAASAATNVALNDVCYVLDKETFYHLTTCSMTADGDLMLNSALGAGYKWHTVNQLSRIFGTTGWIDRGTFTMTAASTTTGRLALSTDASYGIKNVHYQLTSGNYDITISGASGLKYCYFDDGSGTMKFQNTFWDFTSQVPVMLIYWTGTAIAGAPQYEMHGLRDLVWHNYTHKYAGLQYDSGLVFTGSVQADNNTNPGTNESVALLWATPGIVVDEDNSIPLGTLSWNQTLGSGLTVGTAGIFPFFTYNGTAVLPTNAMADRAPFIHAGNNTPPQWENAGVMTAAVTGDYIVYHYFGTPMTGGWGVFARPHNAKYASLGAAQAASYSQLTFTGYQEIKHLYTAIFRVNTTWTNNHRTKLVSLLSYRLTPGTPSSGISATDHQALSNRSATGAHPAEAIAGINTGGIQFMSTTGLSDVTGLTWDAANTALSATRMVVGGGTITDLFNLNSSSATTSGLTFAHYAAAPTGPSLTFRHSRNDTIGNLTKTNSLDSLGTINFSGVNSAGGFSGISSSIEVVQQGSAGATYVASDIVFSTGTSGAAVTEKMRIRSGGYVGVGYNNPTSVFHIAQSAAGNCLEAHCYAAGTTVSPTVALVKSHTNTVGTLTATVTGETVGRLSFQSVNSSTAITESAYIESIQQGAAGATYNAADIVFCAGTASAAPTEQMRLLSVGGVKIKGRLDGTPASGEIGETISVAISDTTAAATATAVNLSAGLVLGGGRWEICYSSMLYYETGSSASDRGQARLWIYDNAVGIATDIGSTTSSVYCKTVAAVVNIIQATVTRSAVVTIASGSTKDYRLGCQRLDGAGTGTATVYGGVFGSFYAKRIA